MSGNRHAAQPFLLVELTPRIIHLSLPVQAAKTPHKDISSRESERAVHLSEHLLHIQRQQRAALRHGAQAFRALAAFQSLIQECQPVSGSQGPQRAWSIDQVDFNSLPAQSVRPHKYASQALARGLLDLTLYQTGDKDCCY